VPQWMRVQWELSLDHLGLFGLLLLRIYWVLVVLIGLNVFVI
jgi:hypothetical protein